MGIFPETKETERKEVFNSEKFAPMTHKKKTKLS